MRAISGLFFSSVLAYQTCLASAASQPTAVGDWSGAVEGLRGRLVLGEDAKSTNGMKRGVVYLELQNVSLGDTMYVYYDAIKSVNFELRDSNQKAVRNWISGTDWVPAPAWLALPHDSAIRFRTGNSAYEPDEPGLFITAAFMGGKWFIPPGATNAYYLSGTLTATAPAAESRPRVWQGTLKLPPLKIPVVAEASPPIAAPKAP